MNTLKKSFFLISVIVMSVVIVSCGDDPEDNPENSNIVYINDDITEVTTWYSDSIYVIKAYDFYVENTLNIQAGTIIKFHSDGPDMILGSGGTIIASGTSAEPIIFTSWKDDTKGGDTNGDGIDTQPSVLDWGGIATNGENGSEFEYCHFYYGGNTSYSSTLEVYGNGIIVDHCLFVNNSGNNGTGWFGVLNANYGGASTIITNNTFYSNYRPLSIGTAFSIDNSNVFHNPDDASEINEYNGIAVESINEFNGVISWGETEVPFVIDDNDIWINSGAVLDLSNGVVLKFKSESAISLNSGISNIPNFEGNGVFFTSYKDDSKKGDTNGDLNLTSPIDGDWVGIYDNANSQYVDWSSITYNSN